MLKFVQWYNNRHCHSALKFVVPAQRHDGREKALLEQRRRVYEAAKARHPGRLAGATKDWAAIGTVTLSPERLGSEERAAA